MQYAPSRIQAPQNSVNESALAQITGQQVQGLNQLGDAFKQFGTGNRSRDVAALIGSGQLDGLTEAQARSKIAQLTGGGVSKESQSSIDSLLGNKSSSESAKLIADAKVESQGRDIGSSENLQTARIAANKLNLGLQLTNAKKIASSNNNASMARIKEQGSQRSSNRALDELFQRKEQEKLFKQQTALENIRQSNKTTKPTAMQNLLSKNVGEKFTSEPEFIDKKTALIEEAIGDDNTFFDAEFGNKVDKNIVDEVIYQAIDTPEGQKALSGGKEGLFNFVNKTLENSGLTIKQSVFGNLSIDEKNKKKKQTKDKEGKLTGLDLVYSLRNK